MGGRNLSLILHQALRAFLFKHPAGLQPGALLRAYKAHCPAPQDAKQEQRYSEGWHVLEAFHWREGARLAKAVAPEQKFLVMVEGVEVTGRSDCAMETEEGACLKSAAG